MNYIPPIKFKFYYRGHIQVKAELRLVNFISYFRVINPDMYYECIDAVNHKKSFIKGRDILNYHLVDMKPVIGKDAVEAE
jgi:hypothetical protein